MINIKSITRILGGVNWIKTIYFNFHYLSIKDAFKFKRKNLRNNLKGYDLQKIEELLVKNNFSLSDRAEVIPIFLFDINNFN